MATKPADFSADLHAVIEESPPHDRVEAIDALAPAIAQGNVRGAYDFVQKLPASERQSPQLALTIARIEHLLGRDLAASEALQLALATAPAGSEARRDLLVERIYIEWSRRELESMDALLSELARDFHQDAKARGTLLWGARMRGRLKLPEMQQTVDALYDAYARNQTESAEALYAVAQATQAQRSTGAYHDTHTVLSDSLDLAPVASGQAISDRIALELGSLFRHKYNASDAMSFVAEILQRNPWHCDALVEAAAIELSRLRLHEAELHAKRCIKLAPDHPHALSMLAIVAATEARFPVALEYAQKSGKLDAGLAVQSAAAIWRQDKTSRDRFQELAQKSHPHAPEYFAWLSDLLVGLHLYPEAQVELSRALQLDPESGSLLGASAMNRLRLGEETLGRRELDRAWELDRFNERTLNTRQLFRDTVDRSYADLVIGNITIRRPKNQAHWLDPQLKTWVQDATKALDRAYQIPAAPLKLEVYEDPASFSVRTAGVPDLGALGVCFGPVVTILGPHRGTHNFRAVLWHELSHVYAVRLSRGRVPRWFTEGLSEWESELADPAWARESAELLRSARKDGRQRSLAELELAFLRARSMEDMEIAYSSAALAIRYLGETYGRPKIIEALREFGHGRGEAEVFSHVFGLSVAEIQPRFDAWLDALLEKQFGGWVPSSPMNPPRDIRDRKFRKAMLDLQRGESTRATATLYELALGNGAGASVEMQLAHVLASTPEKAERHLKKALKWAPQSVPAMVLLAHLARARDDLPAELQWMKSALETDAMNLEPALRTLVLALLLDDQPTERRAASRVQEIAPLALFGKLARVLQHPKKPLPDRSQNAVLVELQGELRAENSEQADLWLLAFFAFQRAGQSQASSEFLERAQASGLSEAQIQAIDAAHP